MSNLKMGWNDRFAVIAHFKPTDAQVLDAFGVTQDELDTARGLLAQGTFSANTKLDVAQYSNVFTASAAAPQATTKPTPAAVNPAKDVATAQTAVTKTTSAAKLMKAPTATTYAKPETATKKIKEPQKRGRKGDRIATALAAVPLTQISAEEFSKQHNVSIAVLRQSKRFLEQMDPAVRATIGKINVRQDKESRTLMIWREVETK